MKKEEFIDRWLAYELYLFILPYLFLYGERYIQDPVTSKWLRWQFEREWSRKSEEEKQKRFESFYQQITESEVLNDEISFSRFYQQITESEDNKDEGNH